MLKTKTYLSLLLVVVIGCGLSLTAFFHVKQWELKQAMDKIEDRAQRHLRVLGQKFITFSNILNSIRGLTKVRYPITRQNFSQFVKGDIFAQPEIQALEWVQTVPISNRQTFTAMAQSYNINHFRFWEFSENGNRRVAGQREIYYPVLFTEPLASNVQILGYDVGSNPILLAAIENARDTGQLTSSGAVWVQTPQGKKLGFRMFLPIYQGDNVPDTPAKRQQQLVGFAVGVFLFNHLIERTLRLVKQRTDIFLLILDVTLEQKLSILYAPSWYQGKTYEKLSKSPWILEDGYGILCLLQLPISRFFKYCMLG